MTMTSQTPEPENSENDELATLRQRVAELEHQLATCQHGHKHRDAASAQRMLQLIIDSLPQAIFWKNTDLIYQGCNQSFAVDAGVGTPTNIVGKSDYELAWKQEQTEAFRSDDQQVIETNIPKYHIIEPQQQADGKQAWLDTNKIPLCDARGVVMGVLGTYEDITERKQIEEALRQSEERFRTVLENTGVATLIVQGTKYRYANPAAEHMTGYSSAELTALNAFWDVAHPDFRETVKQYGKIRLSGGEAPPRYELKIIRKDGTERWVDLTATVFDYEGQPSTLTNVFDITERKEAEEARLELQGQIIEAQQSALREISTPLIPVAEGVVVLPLVGSIDDVRAQQVMETLLQGVATNRARYAIIDMTGISMVDTHVADALIRSAQAVRLLGTRVVLTGIGPAMAQTLVNLGVDLSNLVTRSTLQDGIAYALSQRRSGSA